MECGGRPRGELIQAQETKRPGQWTSNRGTQIATLNTRREWRTLLSHRLVDATDSKTATAITVRLAGQRRIAGRIINSRFWNLRSILVRLGKPWFH
jgi:hypothetical protein